MGEIDGRGTYIVKIPFDNYPEVRGVIVIESDNYRMNRYLEDKIRSLLRDIYYGNVDDFEL